MGRYMELMDAYNRSVVSIVITTYNSASTIYEVLNALLKQQYPLYLIEVIIVDGRSHDTTLSIVERFMNEYGKKFYDFKIIVHERNLGVSKARNDGIKISHGEYILILDSDVVLPPNAIEEMVNFLNHNPDVGCCILLHKPDTNNIILKWLYDVDYGKNKHIVATTSAALLRRSILKETGLYNEMLGPPFSVDEDLEFGARILKAGYKIVQLGNVVAYHLMEKRDEYLAHLTDNNKKEGKIDFNELIKWFLGFFKEKQGLTWFMFMKSLPLKIRLRYVFHSTFLPLALILIISLMLGFATLYYTCCAIILAIFLDVLRDFYNLNQIYKSCILTLLACLNRSSRSLSTVMHLTRRAVCSSTKHARGRVQDKGM